MNGGQRYIILTMMVFIIQQGILGIGAVPNKIVSILLTTGVYTQKKLLISIVLQPTSGTLHGFL